MHRIELGGQPLNLDLTLSCGQAFRWCRRPDGIWCGVVRDRLIELATDGDILLWRSHPENDHKLVREYLRLGDDANAIYATLAECDPHLAHLVIQFRGLRLLKQDPAEALLSFVCSAANSIPRISAAIEALAQRYGEMVCEFDGGCYYRFPAVESIAGCEESLLDRSEVLGFRDRTLRDVACQVIRKGDGWLDGLRSANYSEARDELVTLRGVGRKIADCVCLFALGKDEAVPVDTHIRQIAERLWMPHLKTKSITAAA